MAPVTHPATYMYSMETKLQTFVVVTETKDKRVVTEPTQQSPSFTKLPLELTLDIVKLVVSQDVSHILERSESGEHLGVIWKRLFNRGDALGTCKRYVVSTWQMGTLFDYEDESQRYTYHSRVPDLMHTNSLLRKETREAYLKFARAQMAVYEAKHQELLPSYEKEELRLALMEDSMGGRPSNATGKERRKLREDLQKQTIEMAERAIRWYAMNEISKVLKGKRISPQEIARRHYD
jgi:hypothetical protein